MEHKERMEHQKPDEIVVVKAKTPQELSLRKTNTIAMSGFQGDDCNYESGCDAAKPHIWTELLND